MSSILMSIRPEWVAKILNGEKTIEIRKTMPKCDLPIDVYIYCTKDGYLHLENEGYWSYSRDKKYTYVRCGKVVAKFTLNKVEEINRYCTGRGISYKTETLNDIELCDKSCLDLIEIDHYLYFKKGYAWHISNLEIFGKPRELSEFEKTLDYFDGIYCVRCSTHLICSFNRDKKCKRLTLTKAPQSWCYVEVEDE